MNLQDVIILVCVFLVAYFLGYCRRTFKDNDLHRFGRRKDQGFLLIEILTIIAQNGSVGFWELLSKLQIDARDADELENYLLEQLDQGIIKIEIEEIKLPTYACNTQPE
jgi:hypothetical protein